MTQQLTFINTSSNNWRSATAHITYDDTITLLHILASDSCLHEYLCGACTIIQDLITQHNINITFTPHETQINEICLSLLE